MVRNVFTWCGKNSTEDDGMNFDDCPEWGSCPDGTFIPPEAFWKALSEHVSTNHFSSTISALRSSQKTLLNVLNFSVQLLF